MSYVEVQYQMSERHACRLVGLGRSTNRYRARKRERDAALRTRLKELAANRMRFGYRRLTAMLTREGMASNHKRVCRLYREEGLAMRIRRRHRIRWRQKPGKKQAIAYHSAHQIAGHHQKKVGKQGHTAAQLTGLKVQRMFD